MALTDGLILYMKMNDNAASTVVVDELGNFDGAVVGGNNTEDLSKAGIIDKSLDLEVGDLIEIDNNVNGYTNGFSYGGWQYIDSLTLHNPLWSKRTGAGTDNFQLYRRVSPSAWRSLIWGISSVSATTTGVTPATGQWYFVVATYDGSNHKVFVDGILRANVAATGNVSLNDINTRIGDEWHSGHSSAKYDEMFIYSRGLSDGGVTGLGATAGGEIADLWNSGAGITYPFGGAPSGWTGKIQGITPGKVQSIAVADISKIQGVS